MHAPLVVRVHTARHRIAGIVAYVFFSALHAMRKRGLGDGS
jgi:hypothetical protein